MANKSIWKNIKSVFIVEDKTLVEKSKGTPAKKAEKPVTSSKSPPVIAEDKSGTPGKVTTKFVEILLGAMEKANLEGFDYLEYKQALSNLKDMNMDEATRYKSAFAMAKTMGVTPRKLKDSATHYINVLRKEEDKFEKALNKQINQNIGNKRTTIDDLAKQIANKEQQIHQLQQDIKKHQTEIDKLKDNIDTATKKVNSTKNDFIASYNTLVGQMQADIERMDQHLSENK